MKLIPSKIETEVDGKKRVFIKMDNDIDYPMPRVTDLIIIDKINEIIDYLKDREE
jgi:hypothetical protein